MKKEDSRLLKELDDKLESLLVGNAALRKLSPMDASRIGNMGWSIFLMAKDKTFRSELYRAASDLKFRKEHEDCRTRAD